jgi:hypothetical protein
VVQQVAKLEFLLVGLEQVQKKAEVVVIGKLLQCS